MNYSDEVTKVEGIEDEEDLGVIQLVTEDGETVEFFHLATITYKDEWYVFFQPAEELEDIEDGEVVIFKLEADEKGEDVFVPIKDEKLLDEVYDEYVRLMGEEDAECDDECDCEECSGECDCDDEHCDCDHDHNKKECSCGCADATNKDKHD